MMESVTIGELGATWIVLGGAVVAALTYIVTRALVRRKIIGKIDFMSDALDSGESAFRRPLVGQEAEQVVEPVALHFRG